VRVVVWIGLLIGLASLALLMAWQGFAVIFDRLSTVNLSILLITVFALPELLFSSAGWLYAFSPNVRPRFRDATVAMWIGNSVNLLLPLATIGGDLVKIRELTCHSVPTNDAVASIVLDKTAHLVSILLWAFMGLIALYAIDPFSESLTLVSVAILFLALGITTVIAIQCIGAVGWSANFATKISKKAWLRPLVDGMISVDTRLRDAYRQPRSMIMNSAFKLCARIVLAGEVWLAAYLMGYPIGILECIMLKGLSMAVRNIAFVVPGALGIQEGSFVVLGAFVGLPADLMLSVSLATRMRELLVGVPGLIAWQFAEGRRALRA
jgi:putative membrane protein